MSRRTFLRLHEFEDRITPTRIYTVTSTANTLNTSDLVFDGNGNASHSDNSPITLWDAMEAASKYNWNTGGWEFPGPSIVNFNIPGSGVKTIDSTGRDRLRFGQGNITLNGYTQTGAQPNSAAFGDPMNTQVTIQVDIRALFYSSNNTIKGISLRGIDMNEDGLSGYPATLDSQNNRVEGNFIGVKADGKTSWGDKEEGVFLTSAGGIKGARNNFIGGAGPASANLISGHIGIHPTFGAVANGVVIDRVSGNTIADNYIGPTKTLGTSAGNTLSGIRINGAANNNTISRNLIAFNDDYAIRLDGGQQNTIVGNSIFDNADGGIFLAAGANADVPAPVLTAITATEVTGTLAGASIANPYTVEFFSSPNDDPGGHGKKSLGTATVTTTPFTAGVVGLTGWVTATATDANGNTSVFSNAIKPPGGTTTEMKVNLLPAAKIAQKAGPGEGGKFRVPVTAGSEKLEALAGTALIKIEAVDANNNAFQIGQLDIPSKVTLNPRQTRTFNVNVKLPALGDIDLFPAGEYVYRATLDTSFKGKTALSADPFEFVYQFGTVGDRKNVKATVVQGLVETTYSMTGPGTGTITVNGANVDLSFTGTTAATQVKAAVVGSEFGTVRNITAATEIGRVTLPNLDATGTLNFAGGLGTLKLHDLGGGPGAALMIGAGRNVPATLLFRNAYDLDIDSAVGITSLTAAAWFDDDGIDDRIAAPWLKRLKIDGDFEAGLLIEGSSAPSGFGLRTATVGGTIRNANWSIGWLSNGAVNVKQIKADAMENASIISGGHVARIDVTEDWDNSANPLSMIAVGTLGVLNVGGTINGGTIRAYKENKAHIAIQNINANKVQTLGHLTADIGGINALSYADWPAATVIQAPWIKRIDGGTSVVTDFNASLNLTATIPTKSGSSPDSLGSFKSEGFVQDSTWNLFGSVGTFTAGLIQDWQFNGRVGSGSPETLFDKFTVSGDLKRSTLKGIDAIDLLKVGGSLSVCTIEAGQIFTLDAHIMDGNIIKVDNSISFLETRNWTTGTLDVGAISQITVTKIASTGYGGKINGVTMNIHQLSGYTNVSATDGLIGFNVTAPTGHVFNNINAGYWSGGKIQGGAVKNLTLQGTSGHAGDMTNAILHLDGRYADGKASLGRLDVSGKMSACDITLTNGGDSIEVGQVAQTDITTTAKLDTFHVTGLSGVSGPAFSSTNITADRIKSIILRDVDTTTQANYGITANTIDNYFRYAGGSVVKQLASLTTPDTTLDPNIGNYRLTIT